jgi:hypothetical protein
MCCLGSSPGTDPQWTCQCSRELSLTLDRRQSRRFFLLRLNVSECAAYRSMRVLTLGQELLPSPSDTHVDSVNPSHRATVQSMAVAGEDFSTLSVFFTAHYETDP